MAKNKSNVSVTISEESMENPLGILMQFLLKVQHQIVDTKNKIADLDREKKKIEKKYLEAKMSKEDEFFLHFIDGQKEELKDHLEFLTQLLEN